MRFGSTAKVLLKCKLKYYRISECINKDTTGFWLPWTQSNLPLWQALHISNILDAAAADLALHISNILDAAAADLALHISNILDAAAADLACNQNQSWWRPVSVHASFSAVT